jgi:glutamine synthetase
MPRDWIKSSKGEASNSESKETLQVGVDSLPKISKDPGDRNRTSPFAFTGNRFEFRAPGSGMSIADPIIAINTIFAESLDHIATKLEQAIDGDPSKLNDAVQKLLEEITTRHGNIVFNGNGYTEEWHTEAEKRGLPNLRSCVDALPLLGSKEVIELFSKYGVLTEREVISRMDVALEQYCLTVGLEARTVVEIAKTIIFPAAIRYQGELASTCANLKAVGYTFDTDTLDRVTGLVKDLQDGTAKLEKLLTEQGGHGKLEHAKHMCYKVIPAMTAVRNTADTLEGIVADDLWPLATYQEMLFIM